MITVMLTETQKEFVRENYKTMLNKDIAAELGIETNGNKKITYQLKCLGLKRTKEEISALIQKADNPRTKKIPFSEEQKQFLIDNLDSMTSRQIGAALGLNMHFIKARIKEFKLVRTTTMKNTPVIARQIYDYNNQSKGMIKIEGGGRHRHPRVRWHLEKWRKINGHLRKDNILVYANADYDNFDDIVCIRRSELRKFIIDRDIRLNNPLAIAEVAAEHEAARKKKEAKAAIIAKNREDKRVRDQIKRQAVLDANAKVKAFKAAEKNKQKEIKKKQVAAQKEIDRKKKRMGRYKEKEFGTGTVAAVERRKMDHDAAAKFNEFKKNYTYKSPAQAGAELHNAGKVPIIIDHKTKVYVLRDKCVQLDNGTWARK